jgi:hypothetical protein
MKQKWQISRSLTAQADGQRRWDVAYQLLWQWSREAETQVTTTGVPKQEKSNECSPICTRIDRSPSTDTDH